MASIDGPLRWFNFGRLLGMSSGSRPLREFARDSLRFNKKGKAQVKGMKCP